MRARALSVLPRTGRTNGVALRPVVHTIHDLGFRISTVFAFEGAPIMPRNVRLNAGEHHLPCQAGARRPLSVTNARG
jgi:hypothetical protein